MSEDKIIPRAGVIGWPVAHSRSPKLHGYWLQQYGIAGRYDRLPVPPEGVGDFIAALRAGGVVFEEYDGAVNGIMDIDGNYPSKGTRERGAWFRDSEGNMLGMGQSLP